jgi:uncharacterized phiE125 gp8 family phage protein
MALKLITPPTREPVSLALAKSHLRVDSTDDDNLIAGLITAARVYCEQFQNRAYLEQVWDLWLDAWPDEDHIDIPLPPLQSVTSIKYYDTDDTEYTFGTDYYDVDTKSFNGRAVLKYGETWPTETLRPSNGIVIRFVCGYATYAATVNTVGTAVSKTAGDDFATTWPEGKTVTIAGTTYRLASVTSTSALTLATTAGNQTGAILQADDVPETVRQSMLLHIKLLYDDYQPSERERLEKARDALLWLERVTPL